jgi:hypothetical protein
MQEDTLLLSCSADGTARIWHLGLGGPSSSGQGEDSDADGFTDDDDDADDDDESEEDEESDEKENRKGGRNKKKKEKEREQRRKKRAEEKVAKKAKKKEEKRKKRREERRQARLEGKGGDKSAHRGREGLLEGELVRMQHCPHTYVYCSSFYMPRVFGSKIEQQAMARGGSKKYGKGTFSSKGGKSSGDEGGGGEGGSSGVLVPVVRRLVITGAYDGKVRLWAVGWDDPETFIDNYDPSGGSPTKGSNNTTVNLRSMLGAWAHSSSCEMLGVLGIDLAHPSSGLGGLGPLAAHEGPVNAIACDEPRNRLYTGDANGVICVWRLVVNGNPCNAHQYLHRPIRHPRLTVHHGLGAADDLHEVSTIEEESQPTTN